MEEEMQVRIIRLTAILALVLCAAQAHAAQTVSGTMQSGTHQAIVIALDGSGKQQTIKPAPDAVIQRSQVGKDARKASLLDFAPGDRVIAVVKQDGAASSVKAFYAVVRGTVASVQAQKVFLKDGKSVSLKPGVGVVFGEGRIGKAGELKPGTMVLCRLNPSTQEAWTVVATEPGVAPVTPTIKPVVTAVTYAGPSPLKVRDWMRVDLEGTPGGRATCQVKGLIPVTVMKEIEPGKYRAQVMIPSGKPVTDAALVGRLSIGKFEAEPVQAAKLITVDTMTLPVPEPQPTVTAAAPTREPAPETPTTPPAVEPAPVETPPAPAAVDPPAAPEPVVPAQTQPVSEPVAPPPAPVEPPKPETPKIKAPVALTAPANESRVARAIMINGAAEPGSQVLVKVTYTNALGGLLDISGQVSSQLLAADNQGQFAMGPIPLEGPLATKGLMFTIEASYPDSNGQALAMIRVFGDRE
jgi:hypothetical protein